MADYELPLSKKVKNRTKQTMTIRMHFGCLIQELTWFLFISSINLRARSWELPSLKNTNKQDWNKSTRASKYFIHSSNDRTLLCSPL